MPKGVLDKKLLKLENLAPPIPILNWQETFLDRLRYFLLLGINLQHQILKLYREQVNHFQFGSE